MVHSPGMEIDNIVPEGANDLLFEDILFGERARDEHKMMCRILKKYGVTPIDIKDLLEESIEAAPEQNVTELLAEFCLMENLSEEIMNDLQSFDPAKLATTLIEGILLPPELMDNDNLYQLSPIPNLLFARDPVIVAYDHVFASSMAEGARNRESRILTFIFCHHPEYKTPDKIIDLNKLSKVGGKLTLEGGDLLVLDEKTVAIGWSKRTSLTSIKVLALELKRIGVSNLIVVKLPHLTSFIHLDTTFTRINHDECLIYPPLFAEESNDRAPIIYYDLAKDELEPQTFGLIFDLFKKLDIFLKPIYCGGKDSLIDQKREQWTQGANSLCIAPGIILIYARNVKTIKELTAAGYLCINAVEILSPTFEPNLKQKTAILLKGEELCRARGGPRCLTHPILREDVSNELSL